jgi:hypothetical protein
MHSSDGPKTLRLITEYRMLISQTAADAGKLERRQSVSAERPVCQPSRMICDTATDWRSLLTTGTPEVSTVSWLKLSWS